jgi:hypothetical protein
MALKFKPFLMEQYINELKEDLSEMLIAVSSETNILTRANKSLEVVKNALSRLVAIIRQHHFPTLEAEIHYFKNLAPQFYTSLFYRLKEYRIEFEKEHASREKVESLLLHELEVTERFYEFHRDFYKYYYEGGTWMDERIYIRNSAENGMMDEVEVIMGPDFSVGCYWTARLLANEQLKEYLKKELHLLRNPPTTGLLPERIRTKLVWTDSPTDLAELGYGLYYKGSFNGGKASLKSIMEELETSYGVDLGNYYGKGQEIKNRKITITKFLNEVTEITQQKMQQD